MALADTRSAIGAVSELLRSQLTARTTASAVNIGRPEQAATGSGGPKFNLFLYQVDIDGYLREYEIDSGQPPPIWLALRFLITAFDSGNDSDNSDAHNLLGEGMLALKELNYLSSSAAALIDNPEPLKITFDHAEADLLAKLMQGNTDQYRLSLAFQIRPVMVASSELPSFAPLVQTVGPPDDEGVLVIPSMGPCLTGVDPEKFEAGDALTFSGTGLSSAIQEICFGSECYPVTGAPSGKLLTQIPTTTVLSPGAYPITAVRTTASGRRMSSNAVLGHLLPTLLGVAHGPLVSNPSGLFGGLTLAGTRLGGPEDDIYVAFYQNGKVELMLEATGIAAQNSISVSVSADDALPPGIYRILLRVNGEQAINSPEIDWS